VTWFYRFTRENWLTIAVIAALAVGYLALRTRPTPFASLGEFNASLADGRPTVVEFYANT